MRSALALALACTALFRCMVLSRSPPSFVPLAFASAKGPTTEDMAAAAEMTQEDRDDMIAGMVAGLAARLDEQPNDPEGWAMLIRS